MDGGTPGVGRCVRSAFGVRACLPALLSVALLVSAPDRVQCQTDSATAWLTRGERQYSASQFDSAMVSFRAALPLLTASRNRAAEAKVLTDIGAVYGRRGLPDSALLYLRRALPLRREVHDGAGEAQTRNRLAEVFIQTGLPDSALPHLRAALPLARAASDGVGEATTLGNIGEVFRVTSRLDSALSYQRAALPLRRAAHDGSGEAETLGAIGTIYYSVGRSDSALAYYRNALGFLRAASDPAGESAVLSNIGAVYYSLSRTDSALTYFRRACRLSTPWVIRLGRRRCSITSAQSCGAVVRPTRRLPISNGRCRSCAPPVVRPRQRRSTTWGRRFATWGSPIQRSRTTARRSHPRARPATVRAKLRPSARWGGSTLGSVGSRRRSPPWIAPVRSLQPSDCTLVATRTSLRSPSRSSSAPRLTHGFRPGLLPRRSVTVATPGAGRLSRDSSVAAALAAAERGRAQGLLDLISSTRGPLGAAPNGGLRSQDTVPGADLVAEASYELAPLRRARAADCTTSSVATR